MAASETPGIFGEKLPAFITAEKLAAAFGVTIQTIGNYVRAGMPVASKEPRRFDLAVCKVWRDQYRPQRGHGGKRDGSGKKPAFDASTVPTNAADDPVTASGSIGENLNAAVGEAVLANVLASESAAKILENYNNGEITPTKAKILLDTLRAAKERVELDTKCGTLVEKDKVRAAFGQHLRAVRMNLDGLPATAESRIRDLLKLTPEQAALVRNDLAAIVRAVERSIAGNPLEEPAVAGKIGNAA